MREHDVGHVFYVPVILADAISKMGRLGIRAISAHGEKAAAYMADGYARASGGPAICMAQTVGAANLAAGLKDAYLSCSPVLALTGASYAASRHRQVYQEIDDSSMFRPVVKWQAEVEVPGRLPELLGQAFRSATTGAPGPVHLAFRGHYGQVGLGEGVSGITVEPSIGRRFARVPPFRPEAEPGSVAEAARLLGAAKRPIVIAGGGVIWSGAQEELQTLP